MSKVSNCQELYVRTIDRNIHYDNYRSFYGRGRNFTIEKLEEGIRLSQEFNFILGAYLYVFDEKEESDIQGLYLKVDDHRIDLELKFMNKEELVKLTRSLPQDKNCLPEPLPVWALPFNEILLKADVTTESPRGSVEGVVVLACDFCTKHDRALVQNVAWNGHNIGDYCFNFNSSST